MRLVTQQELERLENMSDFFNGIIGAVLVGLLMGVWLWFFLAMGA